MSDQRERIEAVLSQHAIECTGRGEVSCAGCRDAGWMSWTSYRSHLADAVLDAIGLEQVGWWEQHSDGGYLWPLHISSSTCVPVYRLGGSHE